MTKPRREELRLAAPEIEPPDHLVHQLAELARQSTPTGVTRGRRTAAVVGAVAGTVLLSVGGAWATGAVTLPGLPSLRQDAPVSPGPSTPPPASDSPTNLVDPTGAPGSGGATPAGDRTSGRRYAGPLERLDAPGSHGPGGSTRSERFHRPRWRPAVPGRGPLAAGASDQVRQKPTHPSKPRASRQADQAGASHEAGAPDQTRSPDQAGAPHETDPPHQAHQAGEDGRSPAGVDVDG